MQSLKNRGEQSAMEIPEFTVTSWGLARVSWNQTNPP
jgi:hypothetical protein